jgi:DNA mismatch repair protein MutS
MVETANILNNATDRSLLVLDEVGRGTSTFDGVSIAWAVAEFIHQHLHSRTLFATHYHELTELAQLYDGIRNYSVAVREWKDRIIFLRKIVEGGTDKSYGLHVARLAGIPPNVVERAREILHNLESLALTDDDKPRFAAPRRKQSQKMQLRLFSQTADLVVDRLRQLDISTMTPLQALNALEELKKQCE